MIKGFRDFLLRGNVIELAVAVIIGAAFTAIVNSVVADLITPLIGLIFGQEEGFVNLMVGPLNIGNFINAVISFLLIALVVYFMIVVPYNRAMEYMKRNEPPPAAPELTMDQKLLSEIRDLLQRQPR